MSFVWDVVILGCGQLGGNLKRHLEVSGRHVLGIRRKRILGDRTMEALDLDDPRSWIQLESLKISPNGVVIGIMSPDERTERAYKVRYAGVAAKIAEFMKFRTQSLVWVSSTAVFGERQNGILDEETLPEPDEWRGICLFEAERLIRQCSERSFIFRCSALYTEESIRKLLNQDIRKQLNPLLVSNRIHRDDVVAWLYSLVVELLENQFVPPIVHGVDECPAYYSEIFRYLDGETRRVRRADGGRRIISLYRERMPKLIHPKIN